MNKAILVMDMPEACGTCPLIPKPVNYSMAVKCPITSNSFSPRMKPDWCPLRPLPEKEEVHPYSRHCMNQCCAERERGFNDCINKILNG